MTRRSLILTVLIALVPALAGLVVQNHFDDFVPGFFASVDWDDPYAVEDAVFNFVDEVNTAVDDFQSQLADKADDAYADEIDRAGEKFIDRYAAAAAKYDRKLSKATAKTALAKGEMELFDENYDGCAVCKHAAAAGRRTQGHRAFFVLLYQRCDGKSRFAGSLVHSYLRDVKLRFYCCVP